MLMLACIPKCSIAASLSGNMCEAAHGLCKQYQVEVKSELHQYFEAVSKRTCAYELVTDRILLLESISVRSVIEFIFTPFVGN